MNVFLEILKALFLGIVQGITEWLPISSTGHMILVDKIINLNVSDAFKDMFLVVVQLGSILAVIFLYFNKLNPFSKRKNLYQKKETWSLWAKVLVGSIPAAIIGFIFDDFIHDKFYNEFMIAAMLIIYGILFIVVENMNKIAAITKFKNLNYTTALYIGMFQVLALLPGTSRSGATIIGALILGASRYIAAEFSFFLAIPVMFGASGYKIIKYIAHFGFNFSSTEVGILITGMVSAFIVSVFALKFLLNYIKRNNFKPFGYYRIVLGLIVLACSFISF